MPNSREPSSGAVAARATASASCCSNGGRPGSGISGARISARAPVRPTAAAIRSGWKYISTLVVTPLPSISADAAVIATSTSSGVSRASRGHMTSCSQRSSGSPSPCPRNSTIGACEWVFTRPGSSTPGSSTTSASGAGGASAAGPTQLIRPSSTSRTASGTTVPARSPTTTARAVNRCGMDPEPSAARAARLRRCSGAAVTVEPMSLLAAAATDQGGITGWLLDLVDKLGPVGVGLSILLETVIPPIPSEAVLGAAGVLIRRGDMNVVWLVVCATIGSLLGAIFFYWLGRILGPRRSHAFLDRLPLVETEDVDRTFDWFERHGRSAVFFGRMVPIVRSFVSVPAGVVKMPWPQFLLFTAGGSLIWNTVLVVLGVAAGDFLEANLHYLDYVVVAAVVLAVLWFAYRKITGKMQRPQSAAADLPPDPRDQAA